MITLTFRVTGMHCASCCLLIDDALEELAGVDSSHTSLRTGLATVHLDPSLVGPREVVAAIAAAGYEAAPADTL